MPKVTEDSANKSEVTFPSSDPSCQLCGDLTLPSSSSAGTCPALLPAIVIVAGSGPIDRNGNAVGAPGMRLELNTSNRFAEHMTRNRPPERAVAVLSYDKRGVGASRPVPKDNNYYYRAGMWDLVMDAAEAVRFAASHPRIDSKRIVLLGHSEGAIILPLICGEVAKDDALDPIAGCIFLCGFGENLLDAMSFQRATLLNEVRTTPGLKGWLLRKLVTEERLEKQYADIAKKMNARYGRDYVSTHCGLFKHPAKWFREHEAYDAKAALRKHVACHVLAVTGRKDVQVRNEFCDPDLARGLVPNAASTEAHRPENLTHVLRSMEGEGRMMDLKKDYARMGKLPLDEGMMAIAEGWCDRVLFSET